MQINGGSFHQAVEVDTTVLEEAAVFNRQYGIYHYLGNVVERDQLALGTLLTFKQGGHQLGFELISASILFSRLGDRIDLPVLKRDHGAVRGVDRLRARSYLDRMRCDPEATNRRIA